MNSKNDNTVFSVLIFLAMLSWGGSWPSGKIAAGYTAQEVLVFWRFLFTFASFIPIIIVLKIPLKLDKKSFGLALAGAGLLVAYNKLFFLGLKTGLAGAGGVLVTTLIPVSTFLFSVLFFRHQVRLREVAGLILGLFGGLIMLEIWKLDFTQLYQSGNLLFLLAAMLWGLLTITTQKAQGNMSSLLFSFYLYGFSTLLAFGVALPYDVFGIRAFEPKFWWNIIYLSVVVTTFGTTIYFFASGKLGAYKASAFTFLVPVSALGISWLLLNEQPKLATIVGGVLAMAAVYLITFKPKSQSADAVPKVKEIKEVKEEAR